MKAFLQEYGSQLLSKAVEHFYISMFALLLAIVVAVPLGILLSKTQRTANVVLTVAGVLQTIPTLAVLAIMIPIFGVGKTPAIVALFIYVLLPILNNTVLGVKNIDKNVIQAGQSMGMTKFQLMKDVEMPLALPLIISGIRLSSVYVISWATLASYVGAGGLGDLVFNGLNLYQPPMIISAAIVVTLLALVIDFILSLVEKWVVPKGLKVSR
ncbi:ABC transporter permease [Staphylococcus epidermidis]|jgi:osmoprotectant transport system permease protein|uniref:Amino acid ABC transporter, permease protein n=11 Tax=Bacillota TaxID=1239 RepID=Q5HLF7_STAEQ|nr:MULTISPECIES: ABC transporter permease [Staphylococcus]EHM72300.1 choline transport system permease protein opuBB [Staphylococcus epidermidis 14.1.R1.SE]EHQ80179.1 choline transport system permease protein opuBB [Staphylococcus epidermidis VCU057]EHR89473.1 choline transport system permease protein opuBB [Staphylococcus epidermidis VCU123]EID35396.1 choline transport system permease protein opuBB [Staphylococcus epidermidis IS-250]EJD80189.1 choline transport system permease protein opuBB [